MTNRKNALNKTALSVAALTLIVITAVGCGDSGGGGKIEPLSGQGAPSSASKVGPHPMHDSASK